MLKSTAVSDAGLTNQTLFEVDRQQFTRSTYDRAIESMNAVNSEIESCIRNSMGEGDVSRKHLFANLEEKGAEVGGDTSVTPRQRLHLRPLLDAPPVEGDAQSPVGAIGRSLDAAAQKAKRAEEIERRLAEGLAVVELDPGSVDPSFIADRMEGTPELEASLTEAIREQGQQVPILVRPHPASEGRFQVAYGHRRLKAAVTLGRSVRAVVRQLSDEDLAVAQGQENNERRDLSYIEKARFAHSLEQRFGRKTVMAALSLYKSDLSNMLSVVERIPEGVVSAIGPAPKTGRRGWIRLAEAIATKGALASVEKAIAAGAFAKQHSNERFAAVLAATTPKRPAAKIKALHDNRRREIGRLALSGDKVQLTIDKRKAPQFAAFVIDRLQELFKEFEAGSVEP